MKKLTWNRKSYQLDGEPAFLISGEFHYFRVPKKDWEIRLRLFQEAGGNCVATYIPWILHEPVEGDIRFGDIPERDLVGFLELCRDMGISVLCRPGPYQYSELRYDGLPQWLCENYPEILARNSKGDILRVGSVSYLHPTFLKKTRIWYEAVCPILAKYTQDKGGPIALVQFDNELMGVHEWYGGWDYHPDTMGFGREDGRYSVFLREAYRDISRLNKQYHTDFSSFGEVRPFEGTAQTDWERLRKKDYQSFYFSTVAEYAETLMDWFEELGVTCGYIHNSAAPSMNAYFRETVESQKERFLLGTDHYYNLNMEWAQNNLTPQLAVKFFYSNEMLRLMGYPPTVCELPGGSPSEWPPITPVDLKCCYLTNIAFGMKGANYYIFTGGPNPGNLGSNGDSYDYNAPVSSDGTVRPTYNTLREFGEFLSQNEWLAAARRESDFYVGLDWEQSRSDHYFTQGDSRGLSNHEAWSFQHKGIITSGLCASYSPEYVDLEKALPLDGKPLFIAASVCMKQTIQENLVRFVEAGGQLVLAGSIPEQDENFQPCVILKDYLGGANTMPCDAAAPRASIGGIKNIQAKSLRKSILRPEGSICLGIEEESGSEIAWRMEVLSGGSIVWIGIHWMHQKTAHIDMMRYLIAREPVVCCDNPNVWSSLRTDGKRKMLFLMNLFTAEMKTCIRIREQNGGYREVGEQIIPAMSVVPLSIE